ncbi:MAG: hypothetical protein ABIH38_05750 [Patescibacteria group bacterium]
MKKWVKIITSWLTINWHWLSFLLIFLISFTVFAYLQYSETFADPDSFYHAKMALLTRDQGVVKDFPWLPFTVLKNNYTDQHFLYHVLLIPFVSLSSPLVGIKLATVFFSTLLILFFYGFLRKLRVKWAFVFSVLLLLINPFVFRVSLAKAPSVSLILLILGLYFIINHRIKSLFLLSFIYVWFYGGFILIFVFCALYAFVSLIYDRWWRKNDHHLFLEKLFSTLGRKFRRRKRINYNLKIFLAGLLGVTAGLIINPYFPKDFIFYYHQLVKIGIINYSKIIGVGGEWYHYGFIDLISNTVILSILLVITLVLFFIKIKRQSKASFTLFFIYLLFLFFTLKSRRYVEYYVPFGMLFSAVSLRDSLNSIDLKAYFKIFKNIYFKNIGAKILITIIITYILIIVPTVAIRDFKTAKNDLSGGIAFDKYLLVSQWLENHSSSGSIVIYSDWDDFPELFYHNSHNYYIVGLDPTFMYEYNKDLYWKWVNLTIGKEVPDLYKVVKNDFMASYIMIEKDHAGMRNTVSKTGGFSLIYEDNQVYLYQVN